MREEQIDRLVGSIYDAALNAEEWPRMLTGIARAMNCEQSNFAMIDPYTGITQAITPMWRSDDREAFFSHWQKDFSLARRIERFPVARVIGYDELFDVGWLKKTEFYNDWWLPQGVGGGSFAANLVADGHATASITIHAGTAKTGFTPSEKDLFQRLVQHLTRAVTIQRRLQLAKIACGQSEAAVPTGFAVVDRFSRILHADKQTLARLDALRLIENGRGLGLISSQSKSIERLIHLAASGVEGGHLEIKDELGAMVRFTVIPCSPADGQGAISIDRPAALIWMVSVKEIQEEKIHRLIQAYGLTAAEARVAFETCAGGGRAAIAERCGISPSTVRSHLEAIFSKTNVHRQAELVHLVGKI